MSRKRIGNKKRRPSIPAQRKDEASKESSHFSWNSLVTVVGVIIAGFAMYITMKQTTSAQNLVPRIQYISIGSGGTMAESADETIGFRLVPTYDEKTLQKAEVFFERNLIPYLGRNSVSWIRRYPNFEFDLSQILRTISTALKPVIPVLGPLPAILADDFWFRDECGGYFPMLIRFDYIYGGELISAIGSYDVHYVYRNYDVNNADTKSSGVFVEAIDFKGLVDSIEEYNFEFFDSTLGDDKCNYRELLEIIPEGTRFSTIID